MRFGLGYSSDPHALGSESMAYGYFEDGFVGTEGRSSASFSLISDRAHLDLDMQAGLLLRPTPDDSLFSAELAGGVSVGFSTLIAESGSVGAGFYAGPRLRAGCRNGDVFCIELMANARADWRTEQDGAQSSLDYGAAVDFFPAREELGSVWFGLSYTGQVVDIDTDAAAVDHSLMLNLSVTIE